MILSRPLVGDTAHRVTVPLPSSLKVLHDSARRFFGYAGQLKLYLRGSFPIVNDRQLADIVDDDVIVITWDDKKLTDKQVSQMITTHQADFVVPARTPATERQPRPTAEPYIPHRVTEQTSYNSAYVELPLEPVRNPCSPRDMFPTGANGKKTGTTSYSDEFVWRDAPRRPRGERPSDDGYRNPKFDGETTYNVMYTPYAVDVPGRPGDRAGPSPLTSKPSGGAKFEGSTTYSSHYAPQPLAPRPKGAPDGDGDYMPHRFGNNTSEYRREYVEKGEPIPRIHLELEIGKWETVAHDN